VQMSERNRHPTVSTNHALQSKFASPTISRRAETLLTDLKRARDRADRGSRTDEKGRFQRCWTWINSRGNTG
jgi:hypothetical protein